MESCLTEQSEDVTVLPLESENKIITQCSGCKADVYYEFDVEELLGQIQILTFYVKIVFTECLRIVKQINK